MDSRASLPSSHSISVDLPTFQREFEKYGSWSSCDQMSYSYRQNNVQHLANPSGSLPSMNNEAALEVIPGSANQVSEILNSVWDTPPVMPGDALPDLFNLAVKIASVSDMSGQNALLNGEESGIFDRAQVGPFFNSANGRMATDFSPVAQSAPQPIPVMPEPNNKWSADAASQLDVGSPNLSFHSDYSNGLNESSASKYSAVSKLGTSPCANGEANSKGQLGGAFSPCAYTPTRGTNMNCAGGTPCGKFSRPNCVVSDWRAVGSPVYSSPRPDTPGNVPGSSEKAIAKPRFACRSLGSQFSSRAPNVDSNASQAMAPGSSSKPWSNTGTPFKDRSNTPDSNGSKPERGTPKCSKSNAMLKENCAPSNETAKNAPANFMNDLNDIWRNPFPLVNGTNSCMQKKGSSDSAFKGTNAAAPNNAHDESIASAVNTFLNPPNTMPSHQPNSSVNPYGFAPPCFAMGTPPGGRVHYEENFVPNIVVGGQTLANSMSRAVDTLPFSGQGTNAELVSLMQELAWMQQLKAPSESDQVCTQGSPGRPSSSIDDPLNPNKGCVFCKNNGYHSTFYKSHALKDDRGCCTCPVLRTYVCPLCAASGDAAHTLKYCRFNVVTGGDPVAAGLPPGKVTNWRDVAQKVAFASKSPPRDIYWRT